MGPLRGLYKPRNPFRTPGFAPEGLIDEEQEQPSLPTAVESRAYTSPAPEQMDAPPQQPQRRSIDLSGELDRIKRAPAPPKVGKLRNVLGTLAGLYLPQIGEAIKRPGYADQMREFQADRQYANDRIGAMGKLATAAAGMARAGAESERAGAQRAARMRTEAQMSNDGGFTLSDGQERFDKSGKSIAARAKAKVDDDIPITKELGEHLKLQPGADGVYRIPRTAADTLITASKPPSKPARIAEVEAIVRGSNPKLTDAEVEAGVSKVLKDEMDLKTKLTNAQIAKASRIPVAGGQSSGADFRQTQQMSKAYKSEQPVKQLYEVDQAYRAMTDAVANSKTDKDGVADVTLMRYFAKITDPTTGVKEEEYKAMAGVGGALNAFKNFTSGNWVSGQKLTPETRAAFLKMAAQIKANRQKAADAVKAKYQRQAKHFNVDPTLLFEDDEPEADAKAAPANPKDPLGVR